MPAVVDSAPSLGVYYFLSSTLSVCLSVCHGAPSNCFFFFVSRWNRAIFWPSVLHVSLYTTFSSIFDLGPLNPKIYSPKFGTKLPISWLVWQIERKCLGLLGGFRGWPIQWTMQNVVGPTLVAMATTFALGTVSAESNRLPACLL